MALESVKISCGICFDSEPLDIMVFLQGCDDSFCRDTLRRYVLGRIGQHDMEAKCPSDGCTTTITEVEVARLLTKSEMQAYYDTSINVVAINTPGIFKCLTSRCRGAVALAASDPHFKCPLCHAERCVQCNTQTWHHGLTCKQINKNHHGDRLHPEQLRLLFPDRSVYQCGECDFGPIKHTHCGNLRTHHNEVVRQSGRIKNNCPRCGWFADNISHWPPWDGQCHEAKETFAKRKLLGLRRRLRDVRLRLRLRFRRS